MPQRYRSLACTLVFSHLISKCNGGETRTTFTPSIVRDYFRRSNVEPTGRRVSIIKFPPTPARPFSPSPPPVAARIHRYQQRPIDSANEINGTRNNSPPATNDDHTNKYDRNHDDLEEEENQEVLSCRIVGFYPFPTPPPKWSPLWIFRDTHQAIIVRTASGGEKVVMDFMTEGGQAHPVWWDERVKWRVFLGGNIEGEVRVRCLPRSAGTSPSDPKLRRLTETARAYDRGMNVYGNNCRMFCARMEREVTRLNALDGLSDKDSGGVVIGSTPGVAGAKSHDVLPDYKADALLIRRIIGAALLPALYPMIIFWACWDTLF